MSICVCVCGTGELGILDPPQALFPVALLSASIQRCGTPSLIRLQYQAAQQNTTNQAVRTPTQDQKGEKKGACYEAADDDAVEDPLAVVPDFLDATSMRSVTRLL